MNKVGPQSRIRASDLLRTPFVSNLLACVGDDLADPETVATQILHSASTGDIMITNDGATILKSIALDNAAAKILVNISKVQDDEVGDGTTSVTVLAAELLREAERLIDMKIHPQTIIEGFRIASKEALKALEESAVDNR
jgi:T-complex protein 1 subunit beta